METIDCEISPLYDVFKNELKTIADVFQNYLATVRSNPICFNCELSAKNPLAIPLEKSSDNCISVEVFLELLLEKWKEEHEYKLEITQLKNDICNLYEQLITISAIPENDIRDHRFSVLDNVMKKVKIDEKNTIENFCIGIINGFDSEIPKKIDYIMKLLLFENIIKPFPLGLTSLVKANIFQIKSILELEQLTKTINEFLEKYLFVEELDITCLTEAKIKSLSESRKHCTVFVKQVEKPNLGLINVLSSPEAKKCIITLAVETKEKDLPFYSKLSISKLTLSNIGEDLGCLEFIPRTVQRLSMEGNADSAKLSIISLSLVNLRLIEELNLIFSYGKNCIKDEGLANLSKILQDLTTLKDLNLSFRYAKNEISDVGVDMLSRSLKNLINIEKFSFDIRSGLNHITNKGLEYLSIAMLNLPKLIEIKLFFTTFNSEKNEFFSNNNSLMIFSSGKNCITNDGCNTLIAAACELKNLEKLEFHAKSGKNKITANIFDNLKEIQFKKGKLKVVDEIQIKNNFCFIL